MPTHMGEGDLCVSLLNQMLISSRNTLTDTPRNNALPALWASLWPVKLTHKINYHKPYFCFSLFLHPLPPIQNVCSSNKYTVLLLLYRSLNTPFLLPAIPSQVTKHTSLRRGCKSIFTNWHYVSSSKCKVGKLYWICNVNTYTSTICSFSLSEVLFSTLT